MDELLLVLAIALSFLFGWNNSSFLIGNLRGSGSLSLAAAVLVSIVGLVLGVLVEGPKMAGSLAGSLAPSATTSALVAMGVTSVIITLVLTLLSLPVSFSMVMVGGFLGAALSSSLPLDGSHVVDVISFWFVAPLITAAITFAIYRIAIRVTSKYGLLTVDSLNRAGATMSALAVSYTLGANNIGLIYDGTGIGSPGGVQSFVSLLVLILAASVAILTLGKGRVSGTLGDRMLALSPQAVFSAFIASSVVVWVGTQLAIPVSISQCLLGGMLAAAFSRNVTILNTKLAGETVSLWLVAPLVAFALGYVIAILV